MSRTGSAICLRKPTAGGSRPSIGRRGHSGKKWSARACRGEDDPPRSFIRSQRNGGGHNHPAVAARALEGVLNAVRLQSAPRVVLALKNRQSRVNKDLWALLPRYFPEGRKPRRYPNEENSPRNRRRRSVGYCGHVVAGGGPMLVERLWLALLASTCVVLVPPLSSLGPLCVLALEQQKVGLSAGAPLLRRWCRRSCQRRSPKRGRCLPDN